MPRKLEFDRDAAALAALRTFWEKGFDATSMDELTSRLGIGRASLYNTFVDKRTLLNEALTLYETQARNRVAELLANPASGKAVIRSFLESLAQPCADRKLGCFFVNIGLEKSGSDAAIQSTVLNSLNRISDAMQSLLLRGQKDGSVNPRLDVKRCADALMATTVSLQALNRIGASQEVLSNAIEAELASL